MAAAEDFDPLRIRPYVTLPGEAAPGSVEKSPTGASAGPPTDSSAAGPSAGFPAGPPPGYAVGPGSGVPDAATTMPLYPSGAAAGPLPDVVAGDESRRRTAGAYADAGPDPVQPRRRRPFAVIAVAAAVATVIGTAAFASGLFGADDDAPADALPETTTSAPDTSSEPAQAVSESASASPSPSVSASVSSSASASPSRSREPSRSASPTRTAPSPSVSRTTAAAPTSAPPVRDSGPTLRPGDEGDEVAELQRRLSEVWLYRGPDDGDYSDRVERAVAAYQSYMSIEGDPSGVYGPETRRALEARTTGQDRH